MVSIDTRADDPRSCLVRAVLLRVVRAQQQETVNEPTRVNAKLREVRARTDSAAMMIRHEDLLAEGLREKHTEICYDIRISMTMKAIERAEVLQEGCCERICDVAHYKAGCRITAYLQIPV